MDEKVFSLKNTARLAGLFWVLHAVPHIFNLLYVRGEIVMFGDAALTANNIMAHEFLYRIGIVSHLFAQIFLLLFGMTVFRLFKSVSQTWVTIFWTSILMTVALAVVNTLNYIAPLIVLSKANYLNVFQQEQLQGIMMIFHRLSNFGQALLEIFRGSYQFAFGLLIIKSKYIPGILGKLLIISGIGFMINTFTKLLFPEFYPAIFTLAIMFLNFLGVLPVLFWLLVKGAKEQ